jgi:enterobactin synthetase component D
MESTGMQRGRAAEPASPWRLAPSPDVVPAAAVCASLIVRARSSLPATALFPGIPLPADLERAASSRQIHYLAGRYCACRALAQLGAGAGTLDRTVPGPPAWPADVVGSITHSGDFVSAAVAWKDEVRSIGIDSERVMPADTARRVRSIVASRDEIAAARERASADDSLTVTLVFSIKESLFKCLYPLVGRRFGYGDARVTALDTAAGRFRVRLTVPLEPFRQGAEWEGRLDIGTTLVHTGLALLARPAESRVGCRSDGE